MQPRTLAASLLVLVAGCHRVPGAEPTANAGSPTELTAASTFPPAPPGACATLTDADGPDWLRPSAASPGRVYYAHAEVGLVLADVGNPDRPTVVATSRFHGATAGVFELGDVAVVVFEPWDRPPETVVRAVAATGARAGRSLGELVLPGSPRDVWRVGTSVVVVRDDAGSTVLSSLGLDGGALVRRDEARVPGDGATLGAAPWGAVLAREATPKIGADATSLTWIAVDGARGWLEVRGTAVVPGVIPRWRRASDHMLDVAEDGYVRVLGCATAACPQGSAATYAAVDFRDPASPRLLGGSTIARAADGVFAFAGERLVVARSSEGRADGTEIALYRAGAALEPTGAVRVRGIVSSLAPRGDDLVALGWTGSASEGKRAAVHQIHLGRRPRLVGSASFGGDWTWSPAYDDDRALAFSPRSALAALPLTTVRGTSGPIAAAEVLSLGSSGPRSVAEKEVGAVDRLLFVDGRLLAFSADGIAVVDLAGGERALGTRRWDDLH